MYKFRPLATAKADDRCAAPCTTISVTLHHDWLRSA